MAAKEEHGRNMKVIMMCDYEQLQFWVHIDHDLYDEVEELLASHTDYSDHEGKELRALIRMVAHKLKMDID